MHRALRHAWSTLTGRRRHTTDPGHGDHLLASLADTIEGALVVVDPTLAVVHWNTAMERLTGIERAAACGRPVARLAPVLDAIALPQYVERALGGEVRFTVETGTGWLEARCLPLRDAGGRLAGVAAVLTDVSERRRRALLLRAMEAVARSLTSSLDLNEALDTIVTKAVEVMAADSALVVSWDGKAPNCRVLRAAGPLSERYTAAAIPLGGGPISRAVQEARPVATRNVLADPRLWLTPERRAWIEREGFKAVAAAPLASKGRVHGALVVYYWTERAVSSEELSVLSLLAEHASVAIDNARIYAEATRRAERLRELAEVDRLLASSLDLDEVLRSIAEATARLVGAPLVHLWTVEPGTQRLRLLGASITPGLPDVHMPDTLAFGEGITGVAAESRQTVFVADAREDSRVRHPAWAREAGLNTILAIPMIANDSLVGVLTVRAPTGALAADDDGALVASLAGRAALAIQNARAYADAVRRGRRLRQLASVSQSITASLDTGDVMRRIAEAAAAMAPGALASVHAFDAARSVLRFAARSSDELRELPDELPAEAGLPGLVFERRQPVLVVAPSEHPRTLAPAWWRARPAATYYGVPIIVGETFVGVLDYIMPEGLPDLEIQEALRLLAAYAGIAIGNASLYQAERTQAERVSALASINQRISSALDLDELLSTIAESAAALTGVKYAGFWLADEEHRTVTFKSASAPGLAEDFPQRVLPYGEGGEGRVAWHRAPLRVDHTFTDERIAHRDWWRRWGVSAFAGYPVLAGEELLAVLVLCHAEPIRFTDEIRDVVNMFIAQASVAIQNARLFLEAQRRREVAEALARLGRDLTGTLDLERIADLVARGMLELLGGRGSAVFRYNPEDGTLHAIAASGETAPIKGVVLQAGDGVVGRAVAERRVVATRDVLAEPEIPLSPELRQLSEQQGLRAVVGVPLVARDRVVGALALAADAGRTFRGDDLKLLQAFADQAALAFENASLYASARDSLARLKETQAQLVHAGKMSALGQLVSGVAHELNNPLSVIIGYGQLLLNRGVPEALRRPVELMVQQSDRMARIVRNLLYFARQRTPERAPVDLHQIVEQTLALRFNQLTLRQITVERDFAPDLPPVTGDGPQLQQVFLNLLLNAEQAIGDQPNGRIGFRTRVLDGGRTVRADVIDNGPGIPPDNLPRVFEPFFTTKEVGAGTGLGLSVSYGIVQEHGGRLAVESEPGQTVFMLELPVATAAASGSPAAPAARPTVAGNGRVALVVEDEPSIVEFVVTLLRETGWRVDVAAGGRPGLDRVRAQHYDLVVTDMRMPDGDGEEFYRLALAVDPRLAGRFLFVTGDTANQRAWAFLKGADLPVLEKPFPPDAFLEAVRRVVSALTATGHRA
ncbi:MAG: GAF domain-containing protein [Candidatus Rokuibacteriota bacterium]